MISTRYARPYYDVQQWLIEHMIPHVHAPVQKSYNTIIIVYNGPTLGRPTIGGVMVPPWPMIGGVMVPPWANNR